MKLTRGAAVQGGAVVAALAAGVFALAACGSGGESGRDVAPGQTADTEAPSQPAKAPQPTSNHGAEYGMIVEGTAPGDPRIRFLTLSIRDNVYIEELPCSFPPHGDPAFGGKLTSDVIEWEGDTYRWDNGQFQTVAWQDEPTASPAGLRKDGWEFHIEDDVYVSTASDAWQQDIERFTSELCP